MKRKRKSQSARKICAVLVVLGLIALTFAFYPKKNSGKEDLPEQTNRSTGIADVRCATNLDCAWKSTNCCDENSGARWECVNLKNFSAECPSMVLCPQVISPQPKITCSCEEGSCIAR